MTYDVKGKIEEYSKILAEKQNFLVQLRNTTAQTIKEIDMLSGAVQALNEVANSTKQKEEISTKDNDRAKTSGK
ncbi:hypothetical protein EBU71_01690 [bacterium]|nr:hypothetical protein [Candidatus Elulimicrobium humile]